VGGMGEQEMVAALVETDAALTHVSVSNSPSKDYFDSSPELDALTEMLPDADLGIQIQQVQDRWIVSCFNASPSGESLDTVSGAVNASYLPTRSPVDEALAHLLHDLKNHLIAANVALALPSKSRTEDLENAVMASRHLDRASDIAKRLRNATTVFAADPSGETDLGPFLRRYVSSRLLTTPANAALILSPSDVDAVVEVDAVALAAMLDNLLKNSVEALGVAGGHVYFAWVVDDVGQVLLEVSDDGRGVPESVLKALRDRQVIASSKVGGNGLGLHSVASLLDQIGGHLEAGNLQRGTSWILAIPLVAARATGDVTEWMDG